jgi:hypothetical protein
MLRAILICRFQQAQAMLRKMDAERRHAWEMAEAQAKGGVEDETIEGEPTAKEHIALDNVSVQSAGCSTSAC